MRLSSILICAGAAAAGAALGRLFPAAAPAPIHSVSPVSKPALLPSGATSPSPQKPAEGPLTSSSSLAYLDWLEKASLTNVYKELRKLLHNDALRSGLARARFLKFPASERLAVFLEPLPTGEPRSSGFFNDLILKTASDMILKDPARVAKLLNDPALGQSDGLLPVLQPLFERDGWASSQRFVSQLSARAQEAAKPVLAGLLADKDLGQAQAECLKTPEGKQRNELVAAVAGAMQKTDPQAAFAWAVKYSKEVEHSMGHRSQNVVADLLGKIMVRDPALGAALLAENQSVFSTTYGTDEAAGLFASWAARDFQAASASLAANPLGDALQQSAVRSIYAAKLGSLEGPAVLQFYQSLPDYLQADCAEALLGKVGLRELPGGLESFFNSLPEKKRGSFVSTLRMQISTLDLEQRKRALSIIERSNDPSGYMLSSALDSVPEGERDELLSALSGAGKETLQAMQAQTALDSGDFEKAKFILIGMPANSKNILPHSQVAVGLADTDPVAAVAWVESLADGNAKTTAAVNLAANWAKADLESASKWARSLPPEAGRDEAVREIVKLHGLCGDVQPALELAASIRNESHRLAAIASATRSAWFSDEASTRTLLAGQNLSPEQTKKVVELIEAGNKR
jgi:hypothetical protein